MYTKLRLVRNWLTVSARYYVAPLVALVLFCCASTTVPDPAAPAAVAQRFVVALENADTDGLLATFRDDATVFMPFAADPQRRDGKSEIRAAFAPMFEQMRRSGKPAPYMNLTPRDFQTRFYGDSTAIVTFHLGTIPAPDAKERSTFSRRTVVLTKSDGEWLIAHLHASNIIFDPK
jgi:uncharacterized protein (TIGR02246 family)